MMYLIGIVWWIVAAVLTALAFTKQTNVGNVHNIGLLTHQICLFVGAGTCWIVGSIFVASGFICGMIGDVRNTIQFYERKKISERD